MKWNLRDNCLKSPQSFIPESSNSVHMCEDTESFYAINWLLCQNYEWMLKTCCQILSLTNSNSTLPLHSCGGSSSHRAESGVTGYKSKGIVSKVTDCCILALYILKGLKEQERKRKEQINLQAMEFSSPVICEPVATPLLLLLWLLWSNAIKDP